MKDISHDRRDFPNKPDEFSDVAAHKIMLQRLSPKLINSNVDKSVADIIRGSMTIIGKNKEVEDALQIERANLSDLSTIIIGNISNNKMAAMKNYRLSCRTIQFKSIRKVFVKRDVIEPCAKTPITHVRKSKALDITSEIEDTKKSRRNFSICAASHRVQSRFRSVRIYEPPLPDFVMPFMNENSVAGTRFDFL